MPISYYFKLVIMKISVFVRCTLLITLSLTLNISHANTPDLTEKSASFSYDSLYKLLAAELALQRANAPLALKEYSQQAFVTHDEQIIERALQIANFLQDSVAALPLAKEWVTHYPEQKKAFYQLAYHALKTQNYTQAMTAIDKLLMLEPETELEALFLSAYPTNTEQRQHMLAALVALEKNYPKNPHLLFAHSLLIGENGDVAQAINFIQKAQTLNPSSVPTILLHARLLSLNKQNTQALQILAQALKKYPDSQQLNMHYIRALISNKNYTAAEKTLTQLLLKNPQNTEMLLMHALLSYDNKHDTEATDSFKKLLALESNTNEAYYYLAMIAKRQNKLTEAENYLSQIHDGERFLNAQAELAQIRLKDQRQAQVKQQFNEARQRNPEIASTLYALEAEVLRENQRPEEAYAVLMDAINKHPQDNMLLFSRALLSEKRNDLIQFESDMTELVKRDPNNASYLNAYGYTLADRTDRLKEAETLLQAAIKLKPNDPAIMDSVGWLLYKKGSVFEGLTYIKKAFAASNDEEIGLHLAEILWVSGYKNEATAIWQQLLSQNPKSEAVLKHRAQWDK
jgi:Flp pilus assembly protein TadD